MGRNILFVTTDQQRYDALGCNGGAVARTPTIDGLAANGIVYDRAHPQNVVCMPSRSTMLTGQHVSTHGVWMNGVPLPEDAPSVASVLHEHGYRTALFGKAHFEPFLDPALQFAENRMGVDGTFGPHRGFEHMETATHTSVGFTHYARMMMSEHAEIVQQWYRVLDANFDVNAAGGGDTGAAQVWENAVPRDLYHTDWVAQRTIAYLDALPDDADFFVWVSFPDPHHPWDPPASERGRVDWRELDLPANYPRDASEREAILDSKPRQWRGYYDGTLAANYEAPRRFVPAEMTADQVREVNAMAHIENELIDEACAAILACVGRRGWDDRTDVFYTTDHGELQGDFGLLFKGAYHCDALMRLPLIWRPAPAAATARSAGVGGTRVSRPVGLLDLAPTWCRIAGIEVPEWMEGRPLPVDDGDADARGFEQVVTEWDSVYEAESIHSRTIYRDGWVCTVYEPGSVHDGSEGELYDLGDDPLQRVNRWGDPACRTRQAELVELVADAIPQRTGALAPVVANV
jgi:arylsulfatase A-like enzyme